MRAAISRTDCSNCMCMKGAPTQEVVGSAAVEPNQCSREGAADVCSEESSLASHVRVGRVAGVRQPFHLHVVRPDCTAERRLFVFGPVWVVCVCGAG